VDVDYELRWSRQLGPPNQLWQRINLIPSGTPPGSFFDIPALDAAPFFFDTDAPLFFSVLAKPLP
jgi:hypothetical protein